MSNAIHHLSHTRLTPEVVLHRVLADVADIKAVVVLVQDKDGVWDVDRSQMTIGDLCVAEKWLALEVADVVAGTEP